MFSFSDSFLDQQISPQPAGLEKTHDLSYSVFGKSTLLFLRGDLMTVLSVLLVFLLLFLGSCFWVYRFGFYSPNRTQNDDFAVAVVPKGDPRRPVVEAMIAAVRELPYEPVSIRSHDGLRLCGRYIHQHDGAPLDICFHGYRGTPARD